MSKFYVGGRDEHAVTIGLLDKALVALYQAFIVAVQLLVPLDGAEICGRKKGFQFLLCYEGLMMKRGTSDGIARNGGRRETSFRRSSRLRQAETRGSGGSKQRRGARESEERQRDGARTAYGLCLSSGAYGRAAGRLASSRDRSGNPCSRSACSIRLG